MSFKQANKQTFSSWNFETGQWELNLKFQNTDASKLIHQFLELKLKHQNLGAIFLESKFIITVMVECVYVYVSGHYSVCIFMPPKGGI